MTPVTLTTPSVRTRGGTHRYRFGTGTDPDQESDRKGGDRKDQASGTLLFGLLSLGTLL